MKTSISKTKRPPVKTEGLCQGGINPVIVTLIKKVTAKCKSYVLLLPSNYAKN
jgi:hypothetical protein